MKTIESPIETTSSSTTTTGKWVNVWEHKTTGARERGFYEFDTEGAAREAARSFEALFPEVPFRCKMTIPLSEWCE